MGRQSFVTERLTPASDRTAHDGAAGDARSGRPRKPSDDGDGAGTKTSRSARPSTEGTVDGHGPKSGADDGFPVASAVRWPEAMDPPGSNGTGRLTTPERTVGTHAPRAGNAPSMRTPDKVTKALERTDGPARTPVQRTCHIRRGRTRRASRLDPSLPHAYVGIHRPAEFRDVRPPSKTPERGKSLRRRGRPDGTQRAVSRRDPCAGPRRRSIHARPADLQGRHG
jgi:hypothetical protein